MSTVTADLRMGRPGLCTPQLATIACTRGATGPHHIRAGLPIEPCRHGKRLHAAKGIRRVRGVLQGTALKRSAKRPCRSRGIANGQPAPGLLCRAVCDSAVLLVTSHLLVVGPGASTRLCAALCGTTADVNTTVTPHHGLARLRGRRLLGQHPPHTCALISKRLEDRIALVPIS